MLARVYKWSPKSTFHFMLTGADDRKCEINIVINIF